MCKKNKFGMRAFASSLIATSLLLSAVVCLGIFLNTHNTYAQVRPRILDGNLFPSANGKIYLVIRPAFPAGEDRVRITTLFGTTDIGAACGGIGNACGDAVTVAAGVAAGSLFNDGSGVLNSCFKSALIPTTAVPTFDPNANGGNGGFTGPGAFAGITIGGMTAIGIGTLDVPAASQSGVLIGRCSGTTNFVDTLTFGVGGPTTDSTLCAPAPTDGFDIPSGNSIVFAWNNSCDPFIDSFDIGAAGFVIDDDGDSVLCDITNPFCQGGIIGSTRLLVTIFDICGFPPTTSTTSTTTTTTSTTTTTLICQCPDDIPLGCISGTVIYAPNGQPHPGMTVTLRRISPRPRTKMEVTADSNGCYLFADLGDGKYRLRLKGCESRSSKRERTVIITDGGKVNNKDIGWWHNRRLTRCFFTVRN